jgi:CHAT domain-containing protein
LEAALARQIPEIDLAQKLKAADHRVVAGTLPKGTALVEFVRFHRVNYEAVPARGEFQWQSPCYLAFVLHAGEPDNVKMFEIGEAESIDQMIATFRASITGGDRHLLPAAEQSGQKAKTSDGSELRVAVFDRLLSALGNCKRIFLVPDGDLTRLPFEVLPTANGDRLIDTYKFSYLSTGRDILRLKAEATGQPTDPLVIADPDFDLRREERAEAAVTGEAQGQQLQVIKSGSDSDTIRFKRLPGTRAEGKRIADMLGVPPLLAADVLESRLKACRSPCILHIATHGFFLADQRYDLDLAQSFLNLSGQTADARIDYMSHLQNPLLRSGLALAGANTWLAKDSLPEQAEDGLLTAEDVSGLDLLATELVVLSACETGLGEVQIGEGVFGLRRAFVLAGAKTLVMSLWKVPDQQTQELMADFYQKLLNDKPRVTALREAQLAMKQRYPDPLYWGAFICQGDPWPLVLANNPTTSLSCADQIFPRRIGTLRSQATRESGL